MEAYPSQVFQDACRIFEFPENCRKMRQKRFQSNTIITENNFIFS